MEKLSIVQKYLVLAVDEKGKVGDSARSGLIMAGMMDLLFCEVIALDKKVQILRELPPELAHLTSLYDYLAQKPRSVKKTIGDFYLGGTNAKSDAMIKEAAGPLIEAGKMTTEASGFRKKGTLYCTEKEEKSALVEAMRNAVLGEETPEAADIVLLFLLQETKKLNQYFSKFESKTAKERINELRKHSDSQAVADICKQLEEILAMMMLIITTATVH